MSMITATTWVPRGFAAPFPSKYVFDEDEYDRISKLAKLQLDDAKEDLEEAQTEEKQKETGGSNGTAKEKDMEYAHPSCAHRQS
jgi:periodic tryptophan protein 1